MKYLLIKYSVNLCDEFDLSGFAVCSEECWNSIKDGVKNYLLKENSISLPCGNHEANFANYKEWEKSLVVQDLQPEEAMMLVRIFGNTSSLERFSKKGYFHSGGFEPILEVHAY